jgi:Rod binding domain-containing protein
MERDSFDAAIDEILVLTSGDIRLALRAVLVESVLIEEELRQMRAASPHANSIETNNSPQFSKPRDACDQTSSNRT